MTKQVKSELKMSEKTQFGFVRETQLMADNAHKQNPDQVYTAMQDYLDVIYPNVHDWVHDKVIPGLVDQEGKTVRTRPDFRSEELKLIIEFDGLQHYASPDAIADDERKSATYTKAGYKVVRIAYFVQLTNDVVRQLFGVEAQTPLFPSDIHSISPEWKNTPAYLCPAGIRRMAKEYKLFPEQYRINMEFLKGYDDRFTEAERLRTLVEG